MKTKSTPNIFILEMIFSKPRRSHIASEISASSNSSQVPYIRHCFSVFVQQLSSLNSQAFILTLDDKFQ